jgi:hypothetical protein
MLKSAALGKDACVMIRLTLLLCIVLFATMLIGGQDRGQIRFGLIAPPVKPVLVVPPAADAPLSDISEAAFVPSQPLMTPPAAVVPTEVAVAPGDIKQIVARSANVRSGPGKDFAVVSRLVQGESVLVAAEDDVTDGWSLIRIEGDGVEGYVASRLLGQ